MPQWLFLRLVPGVFVALWSTGWLAARTALIYLMPPLVSLQAAMVLEEALTPAQMAGMAVTARGVAMAVRQG
jgi:hypothetical protein